MPATAAWAPSSPPRRTRSARPAAGTPRSRPSPPPASRTTGWWWCIGYPERPMRVAVLSDIHANLAALDAVLAALGPVDAIWQLGDAIGYGPQPNEVVDRLRGLGATGVQGNHEAAALGRMDLAWFNDAARAAIEWTAPRLSVEARAWLTAEPDIRIEHGLTLVHGSLRDPLREYVLTSSIAQACLGAAETHHVLVGHTHDPRLFREHDGRIEALVPAPGAA